MSLWIFFLDLKMLEISQFIIGEKLCDRSKEFGLAHNMGPILCSKSSQLIPCIT